jgi:5-methylcytosine-specific restriction protein A
VITIPYKPKRPCQHPSCPNLTDGLFCEKHAKENAREYERYRRDPETRRRYGRAWKRIRDRYIAAHPLCEECERNGRLTPAQEVHHIKPLADGGTHAEENLMALCSSCHSGITLAANNKNRD